VCVCVNLLFLSHVFVAHMSCISSSIEAHPAMLPNVLCAVCRYAWGEDVANDIVTIYKTSAGKLELQSQLVLPSKTVAVEVVEGAPEDLVRGIEARLVVVDNQGGRQVYVDGRHYDGVVKLVKLASVTSGTGKRGIGQMQVCVWRVCVCVCVYVRARNVAISNIANSSSPSLLSDSGAAALRPSDWTSRRSTVRARTDAVCGQVHRRRARPCGIAAPPPAVRSRKHQDARWRRDDDGGCGGWRRARGSWRWLVGVIESVPRIGRVCSS
jgi:hypothetical protein